MTTRRLASGLRTLARALSAAADALDPATSRKAGLAVEDAPEGAEFTSPGSEMAKANEMCAQIVLARALRRYSPPEPPGQA